MKSLSLLGACLLLLSGSAAQTVRIAGTVVDDAEVAQPVRSALVMVQPVGGGDGVAVVTDAEGRFSLTAVPAGRYTLTAQKASYLSNAYGAKRPGRPGVTIVVGAGAATTDLQLVLPRGSVIAGTVTQPNGAPYPFTQVVAVDAKYVTGGGVFDSRARTFQTDDQGSYRIWGLPPGDYLVAALPALTRVEEIARSAAENDALLGQLAARNAGMAHGPTDTRPPVRGYAPVYFPGTAVAANAIVVQVGRAEVRQGIDIRLEPQPVARITGRVSNVNGESNAAVSLSLQPLGPPLPAIVAAATTNRRPDALGNFVFDRLPPGTYRLVARAGGVTFRDGGVETNDANQVHWAATTVVVDGRDLEDVALSLQPGLVFAGHVAAVDGSSTPTVSGTRIVMTPRGANAPPARTAIAGADGTFSVTGLHPADWELSVTLPASLASTWGVQSVTVNGVEIRDQPLRMDTGDVRDVHVDLATQRAEVAGTLTTATGTAATDYFIVVYPEDRSLWHETSPRVRVVRPSADGAYRARDLPAGTYRIAAVTDVDEDEWRRASFLESLLASSLPITVKSGAVTRQDLRIR
jgi:hypothetical protein